ncbi:MAG: hypothetical protein ACOZNI_23735 [Myxococcota bacterium]
MSAVFIFNQTGAINVQVAFQESDDAESWPNAATFSLIPNNNVTFTKKFVRFGFVVKNDSGTNREFAYCALRLDTRSV